MSFLTKLLISSSNNAIVLASKRQDLINVDNKKTLSALTVDSVLLYKAACVRLLVLNIFTTPPLCAATPPKHFADINGILNLQRLIAGKVLKMMGKLVM